MSAETELEIRLINNHVIASEATESINLVTQ